MPQVTIDVEVTNQGELRSITATKGEQVIRSMTFASEITTIDDLASWLLAQQGPERVTDTQLQKRLTITYHVDQTTNPDGDPENVTVVDSVQSEPLPADQGRTDFSNLPGWATWTGSEAEDWINANVIDLASAKTVLKSMAKAIIFLRNIVVD